MLLTEIGFQFILKEMNVQIISIEKETGEKLTLNDIEKVIRHIPFVKKFEPTEKEYKKLSKEIKKCLIKADKRFQKEMKIFIEGL